MGKDSELFGTGIKNVVTLETGLAPPRLVKNIVTFFSNKSIT